MNLNTKCCQMITPAKAPIANFFGLCTSSLMFIHLFAQTVTYFERRSGITGPGTEVE